jgi:hypothetical protein
MGFDKRKRNRRLGFRRGGSTAPGLAGGLSRISHRQVTMFRSPKEIRHVGTQRWNNDVLGVIGFDINII